MLGTNGKNKQVVNNSRYDFSKGNELRGEDVLQKVENKRQASNEKKHRSYFQRDLVNNGETKGAQRLIHYESKNLERG